MSRDALFIRAGTACQAVAACRRLEALQSGQPPSAMLDDAPTRNCRPGGWLTPRAARGPSSKELCPAREARVRRHRDALTALDCVCLRDRLRSPAVPSDNRCPAGAPKR
jgi:hypothetical protein